MSSVQYLREFIKERLTAACEEIFSEVQKTIVQYEEEINRQHRLLDISRKPDRNSHIIDLPQQHDCKEEEGLDEQQVCNQERNSSLDQEDPEPPQIKEEQEEPCSSQEGEQLGLKQETEGIIVWTDEERLTLLETIWKPELKLDRIDPTQQQVCDQEDPEPLHIKQEQEELCSSQEGEQLGVKQETEQNLNNEQLLSHSSPEAESQEDKTGHNQRVDNTPASDSQSQTETKTNVLKCDSCGKTFNSESDLTSHRRVHTGFKSRCCCWTCRTKFCQFLKLHTGKKSHPCSTCGKEFISKSALEAHIRTHTGEKPYSCGTCGKRFSQKSALKYHTRIHTGEKPYSCSTCKKTFGRKSTLRSHVRTHTGEKPYSCSTCGKKFNSSTHLRRHIRQIHTASNIHASKV
ncbi:zinc finger protein 436-like [Oreochromis aureus]|uniref:zinc finger protein 436-like n=1 Tax=Oreochromis aureus TaxID=47969 RepID=UPI001954FD4B|nr:zinc finger protein 436-like [Oreochromis aureus]XP_039466337.1 zinc finger protein 436-like [Oreochromis aureus]